MFFYKKAILFVLMSIPCAIYCVPCTDTWAVDASGNWGTATNWSPSTCVPTVAGDTATLGAVITTPHTVTLDISPIITSLTFDNSHPYTILQMGTNTLSFDGIAIGGPTTISVSLGNHIINAPVDFPNASLLTLSITDPSGSLTFERDMDPSSAIHFSGPGQWTVLNSHTTTNQLQTTSGTILIHNTIPGPSAITIASISSNLTVTATDTVIDLTNDGAITTGGEGAMLAVLNGGLTLIDTIASLQNNGALTSAAAMNGPSGCEIALLGMGDLTIDASILSLTNANTFTGESGSGSLVSLLNGNLGLADGIITLENNETVTSSTMGEGPNGCAVKVTGMGNSFILNSGILSLNNTATIAGPVGTKGDGCAILASNFVMNGGSITTTNTGTVSIDQGVACAVSAVSGTMTINDGSVSITNAGTGSGSANASIIDSQTDFIIHGGSISLSNTGMITGGGTGTGLISKTADIVMDGGSLSMDNSGNIVLGAGSAAFAMGNIHISGGTVTLSNSSPISAMTNSGSRMVSQNSMTIDGGSLSATNQGAISSGGSGTGFVNSNFVMNGGSFLLENLGAVATQAQGTALVVMNGITINGGVLTNNNFGAVSGANTAGSGITATNLTINQGTVVNANFGSVSGGGAGAAIIISNAAQVSGGLLENNDTLSAPSLLIGPQGTFGGIGININRSGPPGIAVTNQGIVAPGDPGPGGPPGTMTIVGTYVQQASGVFVANFLNDTDFSQLDVNGAMPPAGTAQLAGSIELAVTPGFDITPGVRFPVLIAQQGVTGQFANIINFNLPPSLVPHVLYLPNEVIVYFSAGLGKYVKLNLPVFSSVNETNMRLQTEMEKVRERFGIQANRCAPKSKERPYSFFKQDKTQKSTEKRPLYVYLGPKGQVGNVLSRDDAQGYRQWSAGGFVGVDYAFSEVGLGGLVEYEKVTSHVGKQWGRFKIDNTHASLYCTYAPSSAPEFSLQSIVGGGYDRYSIRRNVNNGSGDVAKGTPGAGEFDAYLGIEYAFRKSRFCSMPEGLQIIPVASVQYINLNIQGYKERHAASSDIQVEHQHFQSLRSYLGLRLNHTWSWENSSFAPELVMGWQREFLDKKRHVDFTPIDFPIDRFTLEIPNTGRDIALAGVDFWGTFGRHALNAGYNFEYNSLYHTHFVYLGYNVGF